jgi:hypothetical protein
MNFISLTPDLVQRGDYYRCIPKDAVGNERIAKKKGKRGVVLETYYDPVRNVRMVLIQRVTERLVRDTSQIPYWAVTEGVFEGQITFWRAMADGNGS